MKIKHSELKQIIKEEILSSLTEQERRPEKYPAPSPGEVEREKDQPEHQQLNWRRKNLMYPDASVDEAARRYNALQASQRLEASLRKGQMGYIPKDVLVFTVPPGTKFTKGFVVNRLKKAGIAAPEVVSTTLKPEPNFPDTPEWGSFSEEQKSNILQNANISVSCDPPSGGQQMGPRCHYFSSDPADHMAPEGWLAEWLPYLFASAGAALGETPEEETLRHERYKTVLKKLRPRLKEELAAGYEGLEAGWMPLDAYKAPLDYKLTIDHIGNVYQEVLGFGARHAKRDKKQKDYMRADPNWGGGITWYKVPKCNKFVKAIAFVEKKVKTPRPSDVKYQAFWAAGQAFREYLDQGEVIAYAYYLDAEGVQNCKNVLKGSHNRSRLNSVDKHMTLQNTYDPENMWRAGHSVESDRAIEDLQKGSRIVWRKIKDNWDEYVPIIFEDWLPDEIPTSHEEWMQAWQGDYMLRLRFMNMVMPHILNELVTRAYNLAKGVSLGAMSILAPGLKQPAGKAFYKAWDQIDVVSKFLDYLTTLPKVNSYGFIGDVLVDKKDIKILQVKRVQANNLEEAFRMQGIRFETGPMPSDAPSPFVEANQPRIVKPVRAEPIQGDFVIVEYNNAGDRAALFRQKFPDGTWRWVEHGGVVSKGETWVGPLPEKSGRWLDPGPPWKEGERVGHLAPRLEVVKNHKPLHSTIWNRLGNQIDNISGLDSDRNPIYPEEMWHQDAPVKNVQRHQHLTLDLASELNMDLNNSTTAANEEGKIRPGIGAQEEVHAAGRVAPEEGTRTPSLLDRGRAMANSDERLRVDGRLRRILRKIFGQSGARWNPSFRRPRGLPANIWKWFLDRYKGPLEMMGLDGPGQIPMASFIGVDPAAPGGKSYKPYLDPQLTTSHQGRFWLVQQIEELLRRPPGRAWNATEISMMEELINKLKTFDDIDQRVLKDIKMVHQYMINKFNLAIADDTKSVEPYRAFSQQDLENLLQRVGIDPKNLDVENLAAAERRYHASLRLAGIDPEARTRSWNIMVAALRGNDIGAALKEMNRMQKMINTAAAVGKSIRASNGLLLTGLKATSSILGKGLVGLSFYGQYIDFNRAMDQGYGPGWALLISWITNWIDITGMVGYATLEEYRQPSSWGCRSRTGVFTWLERHDYDVERASAEPPPISCFNWSMWTLKEMDRHAYFRKYQNFPASGVLEKDLPEKEKQRWLNKILKGVPSMPEIIPSEHRRGIHDVGTNISDYEIMMVTEDPTGLGFYQTARRQWHLWRTGDPPSWIPKVTTETQFYERWIRPTWGSLIRQAFSYVMEHPQMLPKRQRDLLAVRGKLFQITTENDNSIMKSLKEKLGEGRHESYLAGVRASPLSRLKGLLKNAAGNGRPFGNEENNAGVWGRYALHEILVRIDPEEKIPLEDPAYKRGEALKMTPEKIQEAKNILSEWSDNINMMQQSDPARAIELEPDIEDVISTHGNLMKKLASINKSNYLDGLPLVLLYKVPKYDHQYSFKSLRQIAMSFRGNRLENGAWDDTIIGGGQVSLSLRPDDLLRVNKSIKDENRKLNPGEIVQVPIKKNTAWLGYIEDTEAGFRRPMTYKDLEQQHVGTAGPSPEQPEEPARPSKKPEVKKEPAQRGWENVDPNDPSTWPR